MRYAKLNAAIGVRVNCVALFGTLYNKHHNLLILYVKNVGIAFINLFKYANQNY